MTVTQHATTGLYTDTLLLVNPYAEGWVVPRHNSTNRWSMPKGLSLYNLGKLLGVGSQAFFIHGYDFGNPLDPEQNRRWNEEFKKILEAAAPNGDMASICVDDGIDEHYFGNNAGDTTEFLVGRQTKLQDDKLKSATAIRIIDEGFVVGRPLTMQQYRTVLEDVLQSLGAASLRQSPTGYCGDIGIWLTAAAHSSKHYKRIAVIPEFVNDIPVIGPIIELQPATA